MTVSSANRFMSYQQYSVYHVTISSGEDSGGAENFCELSNENQPNTAIAL